MRIRDVPVALVEILLKPGFVVEPSAVNSLYLCAKHAPLRARVLAQLLNREGAVLIEAQVAGLNAVVLGGFRLAYDIQVLSLRVVERGVLKIRVGLVPVALFQIALDVNVFEDAAMTTEDNAAQEFKIVKAQILY